MEYINKTKGFISSLWIENRELYMTTSIVFFVGFLIAYVGDLLDFGFVVVGIGLSLSIGSVISVLATTIVKDYAGYLLGILGSLFMGTYISYILFDIKTAFVASYAAPIIGIVTVLVFIKIINDANVK